MSNTILPAAIWAKNPAKIATTPLPQDEIAKVPASHSSGKPRLRCSDTIHDSNAEKRSEVDIPPSTRPTNSKCIDGTCSIKLIATFHRQISE